LPRQSWPTAWPLWAFFMTKTRQVLIALIVIDLLIALGLMLPI
jgi:hypothetical protein